MSLTGAGTSSVRRREILLLVALAAVTMVSGLEVAGVVADAYDQSPRGLSYHLFFAVGGLIGFSPGGAVVFAAASVVGVLVLIALDRYRRFNGLVLLAVAAGSSVVLTDAGLARVDWMAHLPAAGAGLTTGLVGGGLTFRGGPDHDVFDTSGSSSRLEFPNAIPRLSVLLSAVTLVAVVESAVVYDSPVVFRGGTTVTRQFGLQSLDLAGVPVDILAGIVFLASVWVFRDRTAEREVTILGATGAGKTAAMAGLAASVDDYAGGQSTCNPPLERLRAALADRGTFPSTPRTAVTPLRMTFRHGWLLPRKVTVRTVDYAGNHLDAFSPAESAAAVAPADADEAFDVVRHLYNTRAAADPDRAPLDEAGTNPDDVPGLAELADDELVPQLLRDVVAHSDSVGLLYPMDDFAAPAVQAGCQPPYVDVDGVEVVNPRDREAYLSTFRAVVDASDDTDLFAVGTKADIVRRYCTEVEDADPVRDWSGFGDTVARTCVGDALPATLELLPVHFAVEDGNETVLVADPGTGQYTLRGADHLLDRMGDWWLGGRRLTGGDWPW